MVILFCKETGFLSLGSLTTIFVLDLFAYVSYFVCMHVMLLSHCEM